MLRHISEGLVGSTYFIQICIEWKVFIDPRFAEAINLNLLYIYIYIYIELFDEAKPSKLH